MTPHTGVVGLFCRVIVDAYGEIIRIPLIEKVALSDDGKPSYYEAIVNVDDADAQIITVNNPLSISVGEDIYLVSISDSGCVFQIVREPWRYFALAGILMLIAGAFMLFIRGPKK